MLRHDYHDYITVKGNVKNKFQIRDRQQSMIVSCKCDELSTNIKAGLIR